jgi:hypothetical protein
MDAARATFARLQQDMQAMRPMRHREPPAPDTTESTAAPAAAPLTGQDGGATYFGIDVQA